MGQKAVTGQTFITSIFLKTLESIYGTTDLILSPAHRVVERQLLIPGCLPEFLETSGVVFPNRLFP